MMSKSKINSGTTFNFNGEYFEFGKDVIELEDSSDEIDNFQLLTKRLKHDGYLFFRGFHNEDKIIKARNFTLRAIKKDGGLKIGTDLEDGFIGEDNKNYAFFREIEVSHSKEILDIVNSQKTFNLFENILGGKIITFDKKWLRCMANGGQNHFHYDYVYVGRGSKNRLTMWSCFTDTALNGGPLVICLGSHEHQRLISTYGMIDMDRDLTEAIFSKSPSEMVEKFGFKLATTNFKPGDALVFGMHMMHSSAPNLSSKYRISVDTRYQLTDEEIDERFFFNDSGTWLGNGYNKGAKYSSMVDLRKGWNL